MGSMQMMLLVLVLIVVGLAVFMAVRMFDENAASSNLDRISSFLMELGTRAQKYYRTPIFMGGGGNSFNGITANDQGIRMLTNIPVNTDGCYSVLIAGTTVDVTLQGIGIEDGDEDGTKCTATLHVSADSMQLTVVNR